MINWPQAAKMRVLTIVDTFSRFSPALEPRFSFRGADVVEVLERVGREVGLPATIRVDQGTNGRFRAECLNAHWFLSLADAREKLEDWRKYYNEERPAWGDRPEDADYVAQSRWAQPARHREEAGKLYPPAIQSSASVQTCRGSNRRWMKVQWQVTFSRSRARNGIAGHDPGRPGHRVCVARLGSMGLPTRCQEVVTPTTNLLSQLTL